MLKEALETISKQAVAAYGPNFKEVDPTKSIASIGKDGTIIITDGKPSPRNHEAKDLETIAAFADRFPGSSAVWVSRANIVLLVDDADRREKVHVRMLHSTQIKRLEELGAKPRLAHRELLTMLRTVFTPAAMVKYPGLLDTLKQVKFTKNSGTDSTIGRDKSSIGKSLESEATFQGNVPEQVTLSIPVFDNSFARKSYDVQCALEVHNMEENFQLFPLPGEIEKAYALAEIDIAATLVALLGKDSKTPVYYGVP